MGVFDFLMTGTKNDMYMGNFTQEQLDYFYDFPMWAIVLWAIAVWGGLLGSVALLLRKKIAFPIFAASLAAMVGTAIYNFVLSNGLEIMGTAGAIFTVIIFAISLLLVVYSKAMVRRGVLR